MLTTRPSSRLVKVRRRGLRYGGPGALVLALVAWTSIPLSAQEGELRFERISVDDGLSHSAALALHQDSLGFLWIGTQDGLNRYDGYDFRVWENDPDDPRSLSDNFVSEIYEDRRGRLWIGTFNGLNLLLRDEGGFDRFVHDPRDDASLSASAVRSLAEDAAGALWVGTAGGLNRLQPGTGRVERFLHGGADREGRGRSAPSGRNVGALFVDSSGDLWIGSDGGLDRFDRATGLFERHDLVESEEPLVLALAEDPEGWLWVATKGGLFRLDRRGGSAVHYRHDPADPGSLSADWVSALFVDRSGELWIGTETQGLNRFDRAAGSFVRDHHDPFDVYSLKSDSVQVILEDRTGIVWLGTYDGLHKYDRTREAFALYRQRPGSPTGLSGRSIWAIYEDREGELWVGTYEDGLNRFDRERRRVVHYRPDPEDSTSLPQETVSVVYEDRSGTLWVGTWGGLSRLDRESERFTTYRHDPEDPASLPGDAVWTLLEDRSGRFWVATLSGVSRFERDRERFVPTPGSPEGPGDLEILALCEDRHGAVWFGSESDGLYRLDPGSERFVRLRHRRGDRTSLSGDSIAALYEDSSGRLWVGTYSAGLNRYDASRKHFVSYREKDGLANDTIQGILEDGEGNLWLATNNGITRFDPRTETFRSYDTGDGLQGAVFSSGSSFKSASGEMFFGGVDGLTAFHPDRIIDDPGPPDIAFTDFLLFNRRALVRAADPHSPLEHAIEHTREIVLDHRHYVFSIEFAALHFASPRSNRYAYRLEGFDPDWHSTDYRKRSAHYSNLSPGSYTFRVKASNGDGVWNENGASLEIRVLPAPWRSGWAWALYAVAFVGAVLGWAWQQARKVEREHATSRRLRDQAEELELYGAVLERFTGTVSHDLKGPLLSIGSSLGRVQRDVDAGGGDVAAEELEEIRQEATRMQKLLEELFELSSIGRRISRPAAGKLGSTRPRSDRAGERQA